jgi:hypothetical protein
MALRIVMFIFLMRNLANFGQIFKKPSVYVYYICMLSVCLLCTFVGMYVPLYCTYVCRYVCTTVNNTTVWYGMYGM